MNDKYDYTKESFLEVTVGNFASCFENMVHNFQKYIDFLYKRLPEVIVNIDETTTKPVVKESLSFIISERDKLIIVKGINFALESMNLLVRKYDSLRSELGKNYKNRYYISSEAYDVLFKYTSKLDISAFSNAMYNGIFRGVDTDFVEYLHEMEKSFDGFKYKANLNNEFNSESMIMIFDNGCNAVIQLISQLKDLSENSRDVIVTLNIVKYIIDIMVALYKITSAITIRRVDN